MNNLFRIIFMLFFLVALASCDEGDEGGNTAPDNTDTGSDTTQTGDTADTAFNGQQLTGVKFLKSLTQQEVQSVMFLLQLQVPDLAVYTANVTGGVSIYRVTYQTAYMGATVSASALLIIPEGNVALPVLSFQNGTNTLASDAPTLSVETSVNMRMISASAAFGYAVVVADYLGFGESAQLFHPYLCRDVTASSLADLLRAVVEYSDTPQSPLQLSGDLYLMGYSQGGHATMALHEYLERTPDFPLVLQGTAAGAGPYDLIAVNQFMLSTPTYPMPYYAPYVVMAFRSMGFLSNDLALYFKDPYATTIPGLFDGTKSADEINGALSTDLSVLLTDLAVNVSMGVASDAPSALALQTAFVANSIPPFAATSPIRLSHGTTDVYIPPSVTTAFQQAMIGAGTPAANISVVQIPDKDHESAAPLAIVDAIMWFDGLNTN